MVQKTERDLALAQSIYSPQYLRSQIEYYKRQKKQEIDHCNHMIKFYKKALKEVEDPETPLGRSSKKYLLQEGADINNA